MSIKLKYYYDSKFFKYFKKFIIFITTIFTFFILFSFLFFSAIAYGPSKSDRDKMIVKLYYSDYLRFVPMLFFSKPYIVDILNNNGKFEDSAYIFDNSHVDKPSFDKNITYKEFKKDKFTANIFSISNPNNIKLFSLNNFSSNGKGFNVEDIAISQKAKLVFNASNTSNFGSKNGGYPIGLVIKDGVVLSNPTKYRVPIVGFDNDNNFIVETLSVEKALEISIKNAVEVSRILIKDKNILQLPENDTAKSRLIIAQSQDKKIYILSIFSNMADSIGATYKECLEILKNYNIVNAASLYIGESSSLFYDGNLISSNVDVKRYVPTAFYVQ